jgi:hypothetical protein
VRQLRHRDLSSDGLPAVLLNTAHAVPRILASVLIAEAGKQAAWNLG